MDFTIYKENKDILIIGNSFNTEQNWKSRKLKSLNKNKEKKERRIRLIITVILITIITIWLNK